MTEMIDQIALEAARKIDEVPLTWPLVRRRAAIQVIIIEAIERTYPTVTNGERK